MKAPEDIPYKFFNSFSMDGRAVIEYKYANDCSEEIQQLINNNFTEATFSESLRRIEKREQNYYGPTDGWLYEALEKYPISGKDVCIMGSTHPWYEAMIISHGSKSCTVIEYSPRQSFHKDVVYLQPEDVGDRKFDACFSISSYEHDGLGRYGDPLNPDGDLGAMKNTKDLIHADSLMYLAVPIGIDKVVFNLHRVYGKHRIGKLLENWEIVEQFGFFEDSFENNVNGVNGSPYQPLYVLRNT
jgi:hypothetical protein